MTEEIIKNPIKYYEDIVDGEDIVIFESGSDPVYMEIIKSVKVSLEDKWLELKSTVIDIYDYINIKSNSSIVGKLSEFPKLYKWDEINFESYKDIEVGLPYYLINFINDTPIKVYEIIVHDKKDGDIIVDHNPYKEILEKVEGKDYYKTGGYYSALIKNLWN